MALTIIDSTMLNHTLSTAQLILSKQPEKNDKCINLPGQSINKRTKENLQIRPLFCPGTLQWYIFIVKFKNWRRKNNK
jgi:hypothetical protein